MSIYSGSKNQNSYNKVNVWLNYKWLGITEEVSQNLMRFKYGLLHPFFFIAKITMLRFAKLVRYFHLCKTILL